MAASFISKDAEMGLISLLGLTEGSKIDCEVLGCSGVWASDDELPEGSDIVLGVVLFDVFVDFG